jgi:hypothetical protein
METVALDDTFQIKHDIITNETVTKNVHRIIRRKNICSNNKYVYLLTHI